MNFSDTILDGQACLSKRGLVRRTALLEWSLRIAGWLPRGQSAFPRLAARLLLKERLYETSVPPGVYMLLDKSVFELLPSFRAPGGWDGKVLDLLRARVGEGAVFYDVGANAGYMCLSVAQAVPSARVYAFEPIPELAQAVAAAAAKGGHAHFCTVQAALTAQTAPIDLYVPSHAIHASMIARERAATHVRAQGFALDELVAQGALPPPHVIKVDVEGAEMLVFEGAKETLARHHPLLVFECDENAERFGYDAPRILGMLRDLGYDRFDVIARDTNSLIPCPDFASAPNGDFVVSKSA